VAAFVAVALLAGLVWWRDSTRREPSLAALRLSGMLVYAAYEGGGPDERLYVLDLATGKLSSGPLIRPVTDLVSSGAGKGWLGLTAGGYAYVLQGEGPRDPPILLGAGNALAWVPGAMAVVQQVSSLSPNGGRCPLSTISETAVRTGAAQVLYRAEECSGVLSIGSDQAGAVYLTRAAVSGSAVYQLGYKRFHLLLPGYTMMSVSPVGDMIVAPQVDLDRGRAPSSGAALFWRGTGGPLPIGRENQDLNVQRVLAWAPDGAFAVVLGTLGGIRSLWTVRAGAGEGERVPTRIGPALPPPPPEPESQLGIPGAAVAPDGRVYFSALGRLFEWRRGERTEIPLPKGSPEAAGPVAWLAPSAAGAA
jgi:hypothetical protein